LAVAITAAACSDDDAADPTTVVTESTVRPETTEPATTTSTTEATTTSSSTTTTTSPPPTTQSLDQFNAEVTAAFVALEDKALALLMNPATPDLEGAIAEIAVPDSPYAQQTVERVRELIANDQVVRLNEPNLRKVTVESIEVLDPPTDAHVNITYCLVGNALLVKNAATSPIPGRSIPVGGTGEVAATRFTLDLVLTPDGWRHSGAPSESSTTYQGLDACPPQ
jgi:hypothetical protein